MNEQNITVRLNPNGTVAVTDDGIESLYPFSAAQYAHDPKSFEVVSRSPYGILGLLMGLDRE